MWLEALDRKESYIFGQDRRVIEFFSIRTCTAVERSIVVRALVVVAQLLFSLSRGQKVE
jgi:hypothetical protein